MILLVMGKWHRQSDLTIYLWVIRRSKIIYYYMGNSVGKNPKFYAWVIKILQIYIWKGFEFFLEKTKEINKVKYMGISCMRIMTQLNYQWKSNFYAILKFWYNYFEAYPQWT